MKRITFSRKTIFRAIYAACVAFFLLAAAQREATAQSFTAPFQVSGSTVTTASGNFGTGSGLYDATDTFSSFTIGSGTTVNSTSAYGGNGSAQNPSSLITASASTFTNAGMITLSGTYGSGSGVYQAVVNLQQGATSITATNSGLIDGSLAGGNGNGSNDIALSVVSTTGNISISNSGTVSLSSGSYFGDAISARSSSGNITITNTNSGIISPDVPGGGVAVSGVTSGTITFVNDGNISGTDNNFGAYLGAGSIQATNTGTIFAAIGGIYADGSAAGGTVLVNNSGMINGGSSSGLYGGGPGAVSVTNSGTITNTGSAIYIGQYAGPAPIIVVNSGTITSSDYGINVGFAGVGSVITLTNSGSITATNTGIYSSAMANVTNSGNITAPTAINLTSGSSLTLAGRPMISGTIIGGATSASTSTLAFSLSIASANLAAAQAQLSTEIAAYATQSGGNFTFTVDGLSFDISNFAYNGVTDALTLAPVTRLYRNTPGLYNEGLVLDNLNPNNARASTILNALGNVPDEGLVHALSELSPKELEVFSNVANNVATFNAAKINNHLANLRDGLTGFDPSALTVQDSTMDPTLNQTKDHLLAYNPASTPGLISDTADSLFGGTDMKNTQVNPMPTERWSSFIAGDVVLADLSHNANLEDANYTTGNVTAGADYRLDDHFTVGALFAYFHTDADLDSRGSSATVDSYSPGIYASYVDKGWYGNGLATYGRNAYTSDRLVDIAGLAGDNHGGTSGNQGTINLTGGYEFQKGSFKFGPVASVQYVHLSLDSMQEEGPTALTIDSQDEDSFRSQLGAEGRFNANVGPVSLTPHVSLSWQHEYLDDSRGINAQFTGAGGGSFVTQTDNPDRDAAFIDAGLDADVAKNVTLFVDYETQAGQNNYFAQSAEGGVKIGF